MFCDAYHSDKTASKWGRRIPPLEAIVDSIVDAVGSDERVVEVLIGRLKKRKSYCGFTEIDKVMKLGRGVYGRVMKKQALRKLLDIGKE